jgi:hypothetical protein
MKEEGLSHINKVGAIARSPPREVDLVFLEADRPIYSMQPVDSIKPTGSRSAIMLSFDVCKSLAASFDMAFGILLGPSK